MQALAKVVHVLGNKGLTVIEPLLISQMGIALENLVGIPHPVISLGVIVAVLVIDKEYNCWQYP
jgi:hypothetical protein